MSATLIRYALDVTGVNPDNLVAGEPHTLVDKRVRAIAPQHGAIFREGVVLKEAETGKILVVGVDYVFAGLSTTITQKLGKDVVTLILVINTEVRSNVELTCQVVGGHFSQNVDGLVQLLETRSDDEFSKSFWDIANRPTEFVPPPHTHDLGDGFGFEYVVYALEKIRNAIVWSDLTTIDTLFKSIDDFIANLTNLVNHRIDTELLASILEFKRSFTKELAGLGKVENLPKSDATDGRTYASKDFKVFAPKDNKYITTEALVAFKEVIYSQMVSSGLTSLGKAYGAIATPLLSVLTAMPNGARITLDSMNAVRNAGITFNAEVYPDITIPKTRWTIVKVSNNVADRGGIFMGFAMNTGQVYVGNLRITATAQLINWKKYMTEVESEAFMQKLLDHMAEPVDPHNTKAIDVGLGNVENLPVASREDIILRRPQRKYVTYDGLLLFMKAFMTGVKSVDEIDEDDTTPNAVARYQMIFAPCGPCVTNVDNFSTTPTPAPTEAAVRPRGQLLSSYCIGFKRMGRYADGFGSSYEGLIEDKAADCGWVECADHPARGTLLQEFCDEMDMNAKYADGNGGFYVRVIEVNSTRCNFNPRYCPSYEIMAASTGSESPTLLGYGFSFLDNADPAATVTLRDVDDTPLCLIYPNSGPSHSVAVRDLNSNIIGYACNGMCDDNIG